MKNLSGFLGVDQKNVKHCVIILLIHGIFVQKKYLVLRLFFSC